MSKKEAIKILAAAIAAESFKDNLFDIDNEMTRADVNDILMQGSEDAFYEQLDILSGDIDRAALRAYNKLVKEFVSKRFKKGSKRNPY